MIAQTQSVENYLKALQAMGAAENPVRGADLARLLKLSLPSVSVMLGRLAEAGLAERHGRHGYSLTENGVRQALRVVRKHRILETFLVTILGLDWDAVHQEAELLEHALSDRVEQAMDRALGHPQYDPEGRPIPTADYTLPTRDLMPLTHAPIGKPVVIRELRGQGEGRKQRYLERGLLPGVAVEIESYDQLDDIYHLKVGQEIVRAGTEGLEGVYVEALQG